jgi:peptide/nickel transport system substrate-binding protein
MALLSGEVDMYYRYSGGVSTTVLPELEASPLLTLTPLRNTANSAVLIFNNNTFPGNNKAFRRAVSQAIDYAGFRRAFASEYALPSNAGFIPPGTLGYIDTPLLTRDIDAARRTLSLAGAVDSDGDGVLELNGQELSFAVMLRADRPVHARYAEMLKNNLAEAGIEMKLDLREVAQFRQLTEQSRAHQAVITGLTAFGMANREGTASLYIGEENSMGYGQVFDAAYTGLVQAAGNAKTIDAYKTAAAAMQTWYADNIPALAFFWDAHVQAWSKAYGGFIPDGTFGVLNAQTWLNLSRTNQ